MSRRGPSAVVAAPSRAPGERQQHRATGRGGLWPELEEDGEEGFDVKHVDIKTLSHENSWAGGSAKEQPRGGTAVRTPLEIPLPDRNVPTLRAATSAAPGDAEGQGARQSRAPGERGGKRGPGGPACSEPTCDRNSIYGLVSGHAPGPGWGGPAWAAHFRVGCRCRSSGPVVGSRLRPELLGNEKKACRRPRCPQPGAEPGAGGGRQCRGVPGSAPVPPGQPDTGPGDEDLSRGSSRLRSAAMEGIVFPPGSGTGPSREKPEAEPGGEGGNPGLVAWGVRGVHAREGARVEVSSGARSAVPADTHSPAGLKDNAPGTPIPSRPQSPLGDSQTLGLCRGAGLVCPRCPPMIAALGLCSGRPGEGDMGESDHGVDLSPTGTDIFGRSGKRAGPGAQLDSSRLGRVYPWGVAEPSPERTGSRGEEPGCGAETRRTGGWVGASCPAPRSRPRRSRARIRAVAPPLPRAAPGRAVAPRFRCKAHSRGSPRTVRNEGGAGHSAPRRPAEPGGAHRTSPGWGSADPATERRIWGQMG